MSKPKKVVRRAGLAGLAALAAGAVVVLTCGFAPAAHAADEAPSTSSEQAATQVQQPADTTSTDTADQGAAPEAAPAPAAPVADPAPEPASQPVTESQPDPKPDTPSAPVIDDKAPTTPPAATTEKTEPASPSTTQRVAPQTQSITPQNSPESKPGTLQPVWCHLTGNDWKAQLGNENSGGRHEAFALMGDFGWGTTPGGQTLAHDRSDKLDAACGAQVPQDPEPLVSYSQWQDGDQDCYTATVEQTRTKTVTPRSYELQDGQWVLVNGTPVITTESQTRTMTDGELQACTPKPNPEPTVSYGAWEDGQGDCDTQTVTQTRTKTVITYAVNWVEGQWVVTANTPVVTTETQSRAMTDDEVKACTTKPNPEPTISYGVWEDGDQNCEAGTVEQHRSVTTITYEVNWVDGHWIVTASEPVVTSESGSRAMTDDELKACSPKPNPEPTVSYGAWEDGKKDCTAKTVEQTRSVTTITYTVEWHDGKWIVTASEPVVTSESGSRAMTDDESAACKVTPPTTPSNPSTPTKPGDNSVPSGWTGGGADSHTGGLAQTGGSLPILPAGLGLAALLAGLAALAFSKWRRPSTAKVDNQQ